MKQLITILSIILLIGFQSNGQSPKNLPIPGNNERIVKTFPNPATSFITFDIQSNYKNGLSIYIYNGVLGKKMYESANVQEKTTVTLTDFTRGMYIYHLVDATGKIIESGKFQVSR